MNDFNFSPPTGLRDVTAYPNEPTSEAAAREQFQGILDQIKAFLNNIVKPELAGKASKTLISDFPATLQNGWSGALSYAKNDLGQVWLRGSITVGTKTMATSIVALPSDFLPSYTVPVTAFDTSGTIIDGLAIYPAAGGLFVYHPADTSLVSGNTIHINTLYKV